MRSIIVLTVICFISGAVLSFVNILTSEKILQAQESIKKEAIKEIFNFKISQIKSFKRERYEYFEVYADNNVLSGIAVISFTNKGYGGKISVLVGIDMECRISDYRVLSHSETPGLGDKISDANFKSQFKGKGMMGFVWKVKKDGGDVQAITAATISSRAITEALFNALNIIKGIYPERCK